MVPLPTLPPNRERSQKQGLHAKACSVFSVLLPLGARFPLPQSQVQNRRYP